MKKLQNESFVSRAPEEVVEAERQKVATSEASLERLRHTLDSISE
jgi:valyl-tRNA synthetase